MKERSAKGLKGYLIGDNTLMVYTNGPGKDPVYYHIVSPDLEVTITDEDAMIKLEETDEPIIDVSNQTIGYNET